MHIKIKQSLCSYSGFLEVEAPKFQDKSEHEGGNVVSLPPPPGNIPGTLLCLRLSRPQGDCATENITSIKNSSDTIGNRTRVLQDCSAVPQRTAPSNYAYMVQKIAFGALKIHVYTFTFRTHFSL
jgi:hypothetical protein